MNKLTRQQRVRIVAALVEGNSIRSTCRMTGAAKGTVLKLLADMGAACRVYHDRHVRRLSCRRIQCDEIWSFVWAKEKNLPESVRGALGFGDVWTWTALDADCKLIVGYLVGHRDAVTASDFMNDVAGRLSFRVQLTTDGHTPYLIAVEDAFAGAVDYAMLVKLYGLPEGAEIRYSPAECIGIKVSTIQGAPDRDHISTSFVERQNLTMRMGMRRFTRLTNAFSKKLQNHEHAIALHFMHYNFCRVHQTLRETPAQAAGIADRRWTVEDLVRLLEIREWLAARGRK